MIRQNVLDDPALFSCESVLFVHADDKNRWVNRSQKIHDRQTVYRITYCGLCYSGMHPKESACNDEPRIPKLRDMAEAPSALLLLCSFAVRGKWYTNSQTLTYFCLLKHNSNRWIGFRVRWRLGATSPLWPRGIILGANVCAYCCTYRWNDPYA